MKFVVCPYCKTKTSWKVRDLTKTSVWGCHACSIGFQVSPPKEQKIKEYYIKSVYPQVWGDHQGAFAKMKEKTYQRIFKYLPDHLKNKTFIDIGCGYGFFLKESKKHGMKVIGVEPSPYLSKVARQISGAKIINDFFHNPDLNFKNKFNVVAIIDVVEHFRDPFTALEKTLTLVKKGGLLVLTTPDFSSPSRKIMRKFWHHFKDEHYYYLSGDFFKGYLPKQGFKLISLVSQPRAYSLDYLENHFKIYNIPFFSNFLHLFISKFPPNLKKQAFLVPGPLLNGNLLLVAKKIA